MVDNKCIAFIELYDKDFQTKLIAEKTANNVINAIINSQIIVFVERERLSKIISEWYL